MHLKVTIVDGKAFTTGAFNYSKAASYYVTFYDGCLTQDWTGITKPYPSF